MERLFKRSDGFIETPSGKFAVVPKYSSGTEGDLSWFEFKGSIFSETIRIEWPTGAPFIIVDEDVARVMLVNGYGGVVSDDLTDRYNQAVDDYMGNLGDGSPLHPEAKPPEAKPPEQPEQEAPPPPPAPPEPPIPPPAPPEPPAPAPPPPAPPAAPVAPAPAKGDDAPAKAPAAPAPAKAK